MILLWSQHPQLLRSENIDVFNNKLVFQVLMIDGVENNNKQNIYVEFNEDYKKSLIASLS